MSAAVFYFVIASATLWLTHRFVVPVSRTMAAALLLLPLAFTGPALLTGRVYAPIDLPYQSYPLHGIAKEQGIDQVHNAVLSDVYCLNIPWRKAVREAYGRGELALWNPHLFVGDILSASAQPTPYEPYFLASLLLPMATSLTFLAAITLFLLGNWMFAWLRDIGCSERASLLGAVGWMFGNFLVFWLEWVITPTLAWTPLVFVGVRRLARERSPRGLAILTLAFVMLLLSGHPESALHVVSAAGVYALFELFRLRLPRREVFRSLGVMTVAGILSLLLVAIYLLPILQALPQTAEHFSRRMIYAQQDRSLPLRTVAAHLLTNVIPFRYGAQHEVVAENAPIVPMPQNAYPGSLLFPIALLGLWRSRAPEKWLLLGFAILGYLGGTDAPPVADLLARLPLYDIAINSRLIVLSLFGLAGLAALGIDAWLGDRDSRRLAALTGTVLILLAASVAFFWPRMLAGNLPSSYLLREGSAFLVPLALALLVVLAVRSRPMAFVMLLLLLVGQRTA
ncbi:MAG TPA: hypothetical protein VM534_10310, partial [Thermoanaerobaculia bacterium]|nr:hypothetical protein [Thermoanaerobaculia bacterium]